MIIKIDISSAFNSTCRALTLDVLSGRASRDYACGPKRGDAIATSETLSNMVAYFKSMRACHAKLRYFDWDGLCHLAKGLTGGQHGVIHRRSAEEHCDNRNSSYSDWSSQPQICSCMLQVTPKKQTLNPKPRVTEANAPPGTTHPRSQPMLCECSNSQTG